MIFEFSKDNNPDTTIDKSVSFEAGKTYNECASLIEAINHNCDKIYFDRIPIMYEYNHEMNVYQLYTSKLYQKALEYCLKDMFWN